MTDIFISYSRRDKVFTQKLVDALIAAKRDVWADWASIPAASDWEAEIYDGIEKTNTVLFVLSPEWIKSNEPQGIGACPENGHVSLQEIVQPP